MGPRKFQHENSYACLLAEVLEEEAGEAEKSPQQPKRAGEPARQSIVELASASVRRPRKIGAAAAAASAAAASTSTPSPAPALPPLLVERDDASLPDVLRFNRFIQTGYRRAPLSKRQCLCSLGYCHNETFNVLSHLVPLALLLLSLATGTLSATWPRNGGTIEDWSLVLHALPVVLCLSGSVAYHLMMADFSNYSKYLSVDVCGILLMVVDGTRAMASRPAGCVAVSGSGAQFSPLALLREALVSLSAARPPPSLPSLSRSSVSSALSSAALARDAALASYAALVVLAASKALRGRTAAERGVPLLALLVARFAVLAARFTEVKNMPVSSASSSSSLRAALGWYACAEAASFVGGLFNVLRVPERWVKPLPPPKRAEADGDGNSGGSEKPETHEVPRFRLVDFAFNSHNLMHLFSLVALGCYHAAAAEDRKHWLEHGCGTGS